MSELTWDILMVIYLFLGGLAGGSYIISALVDLFKGEKYKVLSKSAALTSVVAIIASIVVLLLEIKRFKVQPLVFLFAYVRFPYSMVSVGTWILTALLVVSVVSVLLGYLDGNVLLRKIMAVVGFILGLSTAAYTGILLSFARGGAFWFSGFLPWLFILSGVLTGLAFSMLMIPVAAWVMPKAFGDFKALWDSTTDFVHMIEYTDKYAQVLIGLETIVMLLYFITAPSNSIIWSGSWISLVFYAYVILGLLIPLAISYYVSKLASKGSHTMSIYLTLFASALALFGGVLLRYVVLIAGQLIH